MVIELILIKQLLQYNNYIQYNKYIDKTKIKEIHKEIHNIYITLEDYYLTYKQDITVDELELFFYSQRPYLKETDKAIYNNLFNQLRTSEAQAELVTEVLKQLKQRQEAFALSSLAYDVSQGKAKFIDLITFAHSLEHEEKLDEVDNTVFVSDDLGELYEKTVKQVGLRWRLTALNRMLGSLRQGDFGFIFARPETGKTTFLASEISCFAEQTVRPILWFNNEEQGSKVMLRIYQATLGLTLTELFSDLNTHKRKYHELTKGNIKLYDSGNISRTDVERLVYQFKPSCIIFDQIDKIKGFVNDREDLRLGAIYQWARELAKEYCPVIGVCQADGSGEGQKWLTMANVANAKTAKQAEADWIVGIGKSNSDGMEYVRHLHASKNKLAGDEDSDGALRHGKVDVVIKPDIARYVDVGS
jgi:replicative DNA helicase